MNARHSRFPPPDAPRSPGAPPESWTATMGIIPPAPEPSVAPPPPPAEDRSGLTSDGRATIVDAGVFTTAIQGAEVRVAVSTKGPSTLGLLELGGTSKRRILLRRDEVTRLRDALSELESRLA